MGGRDILVEFYVPCGYSHAGWELPWVARVFVIVVSLSFQHCLTFFVC